MSQRVAVYLRQSQDRSGDGLGIDRQRQDVLRLVEARGWTVAAEFVDNDISALSRKPRPAFTNMMARVEAGEFDVIVARHTDRLLRRLADLEEVLARCEKASTILVTASEGVDTSTDGGRLFARIASSVAQGEVERKSARQKSAAIQAARQGRWVGGRRPFGYEADGVTIRTDEAALITQGYKNVLAGESLSEVARRWSAAGFATPQGRQEWTRTGVKDVLTNPRYCGLRRYRPSDERAKIRQNPALGITGPAVWDGVVDETTWRAAVRVLCDPGRHTGARNTKGLLTGVGLCGVCGMKVHRGGAAHGKPMYRCSSGRHVSRLAEPIDAYVQAEVVEWLKQPAVSMVFKDDDLPDAKELIAEAEALRLRRDMIAEELADGFMERSQFRIANSRLLRRLAEVEARIASAGSSSPLGIVAAEDAPLVWLGLTPIQRRGIIEKVVTPVLHLVGAGTRTFHPDSVGLIWKLDYLDAELRG
jgi:site-specific DNA recombinase